MLVISVYNRPYKVLDILGYLSYDRVEIMTELGPFMGCTSDIYIL